MSTGLPDQRISARFSAFLFGPVEAVRFRAFEWCFVASFLFYMGARFLHVKEWLTPAGFHYSTASNLPYQIDPFPLLPFPAAVALGVVTFLAGGCVLRNRWRRAGLALLFAIAVYVQHADSVAAFTLNKFYIVGMMLLLLSPKVPNPVRGEKIESAWSFRILQATILIQLFTAGTCKLFHGDWHQYADVLWTQSQGIYRTEAAAWLLRNLPKSGWAVMQHIALAFELVGPFLIAWKKTRWFGLIWALGFVSLIALTMKLLIFFMLQMVAFFLLFVTAEQWERTIRICRTCRCLMPSARGGAQARS